MVKTVPDHKTFSEQDLQRQLTLTRNQLKDLRMSNETNQAKLIDHTRRQGVSDYVSPLKCIYSI